MQLVKGYHTSCHITPTDNLVRGHHKAVGVMLIVVHGWSNALAVPGVKVTVEGIVEGIVPIEEAVAQICT